MSRPSKIKYYLEIAHAVARRGTCRRRNYGAVVVNGDQIVGTGYSGSPRGRVNCLLETELPCPRSDENVPSGMGYEMCRSVHAEANALLAAGRERTIGAVMFVSGIITERPSLVPPFCKPCEQCMRLVINAGIVEVVYVDPDQDSGFSVIDMAKYVEECNAQERGMIG